VKILIIILIAPNMITHGEFSAFLASDHPKSLNIEMLTILISGITHINLYHLLKASSRLSPTYFPLPQILRQIPHFDNPSSHTTVDAHKVGNAVG
jgi:hypothetical protein